MEWLALSVIVLGLVAFAVVRRYDLTNPYRDGTTHTATLSNESAVINGLPECSNSWYIQLDNYTWRPERVPRSWGSAPVAGKLHIIASQDPADQHDKRPSATFTARGITLDLGGGKMSHDWGFAMNCAGYPVITPTTPVDRP